MARGKARKRKSIWRGLGYLVLAALTLLVAGFIVRRDLGPALWFYVTHRPPPRQGQALGITPVPAANAGGTPVLSSRPGAGGKPAMAANAAGDDAAAEPAPSSAPEQFTAPERHVLDDIIRKHAK